MSIYFCYIFLLVGFVFALMFGVYLSRIVIIRKSQRDIRDIKKRNLGITNNNISDNILCDGISKKILQYLLSLSYKLSALGISNRYTKKFIKSNVLNARLKLIVEKSKMPKYVNNYAIRECQFRLSFFLGITGLLLGLIFSYFLMFLLLFLGITIGYILPVWAMKNEAKARLSSLDKNFPEMLEVVSLGLRSGLTFDRSLKIYTKYFDNEFSNNFKLAQNKWESGLASRETALRDIAKSYDSKIFSRTIENIIRALHYGSSLIETLEDACVETRKNLKSKLEEQVAKAPVKMMIPTGTLILPAMLILVLGPILLELINGF